MTREVFRNLVVEAERLRAQGLLVLEGRHLFNRLLEGGGQPEAVLCVPALLDEMNGLSNGRWPVFALSEPEIGRLVGFSFHRGLLAVARRPTVSPFEGTAGLPRSVGVVALPRITDEFNLGAILRCAAAFGVRTVLLGHGCGDPFSRKALRSGMGASLRLQLYSAQPNALVALHQNGYRILAAHRSTAAVSLDEVTPQAPWVVVFGHETEGVPPDWFRECEQTVWIPMEGGMDSLNVAVSAGIVLWELVRKRRSVRIESERSS